MERAQADGLCDVVEGRLLAPVRVEVLDRTLDALVVTEDGISSVHATTIAHGAAPLNPNLAMCPRGDRHVMFGAMDGLDQNFGFTLQPQPPAGGPAAGGAVLRPVEAALDAPGMEPAALADRLNGSQNRTAAALALAGTLRLLADGAGPSERQPVSEVLQRLDSRLFAAALKDGLDLTERRRMIRGAIPVLSPGAVLALAMALASAHDVVVSEPLAALLRKLAREAESGAAEERRAADESFRTLIAHVTDVWLARVLSAVGTGFDDMFQQAVAPAASASTLEPERVLQVALEANTVGNAVWDAVKVMVEADRVHDLLQLLKVAPAGNKATQMIAEQIASPTRLAQLLRADSVDFEAIDALTAHMGIAAAEVMLAELVESKSRTTRRALLDRLTKYGPALAPLVVERLNDRRWFVVRNMIALLRDANCPLDRVPVDTFVQHEDGRVRREAYQLLFRDPVARDRALCAALRDDDKNVLRAALQHARGKLPDAGVPILAKRVVDGEFPPEFRVISLHLLGRTSSILALDALLAWVHGGKTLLGKPKLAPKSPEMLAALAALARSWAHDRRAAALIGVALKSDDDQIVAAAQARGGEAPSLQEDA